ncbi:MAG: SpoIIE family protein phosphatase [Pseudomonadales bacterium]|nr:SpoIIE family protein phosphatase [Pseudomonadales bacterium]
MSVGRKEVLVVGEAAGTLGQVQGALAGSGYDIELVSSEEDCLGRFHDTVPAIVFVETGAASIDAAHVIATIREREAEIPVVLMARATEAATLVPLMSQGATDYLIFPVPDESLIAYALRRNIERRRETRKRKRAERELKKLNKTLLESLQVLEQDQQAGSRVQQGMMPESPFECEGITLTHLIVPSLILSGDFIDYFELPDHRLLFYFADVSGHGTSGAIVTVLLKSLSGRLYNEFEELGLEDAGQILVWINRELLACGLEQHVTMFLGVVDHHGKRLQYANAAQFPPSIFSTAEGARYLEMGGLPLGIYPTARYQSHELELPAAFALVMFSDGVFEIMPEEKLSAKEERLRSLVECGCRDVDSIADHLGLSQVTEVPDDIAVFTVARAG